ncbi:esterase-like activity of phytase family protein [Sphingomicrobium sediminis]|uniref:Esterase-like activity of phytase family protein n=1 Tax=Sphingomicrobium sediminis TaxID=2950949 RepID=A0A9X2EHV0_9SPHN|nr:esterase-like activity of phytase family protein [Sphingomicrobium sediminis]MCM8557842.1 esterase-like activity of phytase family protein [Sphingomicrobium sediminis]
MQHWFMNLERVALSVLLAATITYAHRNHVRPATPLPEPVEQVSLRSVSIEGDLPSGWTVGAAWQIERGGWWMGGFSGLEFDGENLVTLSDSGVVHRFTPPGPHAESLELRPLVLMPEPLSRDSEAILVDGDRLRIAFEGDHRVADYRADGALESDVRIANLFKRNRGVEALLAGDPAIAFGELGDVALSLENEPRELEVRGARYSVTGAARWPGSDQPLLLLRQFGLFGMRAFVAAADVGEDAVEVSELQPLPLGRFDNAEGLAVRAKAGGGYEVWVVTDDNRRAPLRSLLVRFDVAPDGWPEGLSSD